MSYVQIGSFDNYIAANLQLQILQEEGIACYLKDEYTITLDPLLSPAIGGIKLMVPESQSERAVAILDEVSKKFLQHFACPRCGAHALEAITEVTRPTGFWNKLKLVALNGQPQQVKNYYRCTSCNLVMDELIDPAN